jgi:hypothetical protein
MHPVSGAQDCFGHEALSFLLFDAFLQRRVLALPSTPNTRAAIHSMLFIFC